MSHVPRTMKPLGPISQWLAYLGMAPSTRRRFEQTDHLLVQISLLGNRVWFECRVPEAENPRSYYVCNDCGSIVTLKVGVHHDCPSG
jgi:hypothetical protein